MVRVGGMEWMFGGFFLLFGLVQLAIIVSVLWLLTRLTKAVERIERQLSRGSPPSGQSPHDHPA